MIDRLREHFSAVAGRAGDIIAENSGIEIRRFVDDHGNAVLLTLGLCLHEPEAYGASRIELCAHCRPADEPVMAVLLQELAAMQNTGASRLYWFHGVALGRAVEPGSTLAAVFLTWPLEPFDLETATLAIDGQRIDIVQAIPITLAELDCLVAKGAEALEERLEAARIDITDLGRPSAC